MNFNQKQQDALVSILEYEQIHDPKEFSLGWSWSDVRVAPATLNNLLLKGLLEEKFHSNSYRGLGSISNTVEIATGWYKPQEHFPPVNIDIPQAIRYAL
jgi:hypothetical protein